MTIIRFPHPQSYLGGPWSPFENNWHLREEYKRTNRRLELAAKLSAQITWVALANLVLSPVIFLWQLMYFFCSYGDVSGLVQAMLLGTPNDQPLFISCSS